MNHAPESRRFQRTPAPARPRETRRTISRQAQDWQFRNRNRRGREAECSVWNAVSHIQASGTAPTIRMVGTLTHRDARQVRRILKRLEHAGLMEWRRKEARYKNNRLQWVPISLKWENLRQIETTRTSTLETTLPKSFGVKCLTHTDVSERKIAPASGRTAERSPENRTATPRENQNLLTGEKKHADSQSLEPTLSSTHPEEWDCAAIANTLLHLYRISLPIDFLRFLVDRIDCRGGRTIRHFRSYFARAVYRLVCVERGSYEKAQKDYRRRDELAVKWFGNFNFEVRREHAELADTFNRLAQSFRGPDLTLAMCRSMDGDSAGGLQNAGKVAF